MATPLKVGLVGTGGISNRHITAYLEHPDRVKITAVCDLDESRAQEFAKKAGIDAVYTDFDKMLREADIEAVDNCTGHAQHASLCIAAAEAGKHAIVEKAMALSMQECRDMIAAADKAGRNSDGRSAPAAFASGGSGKTVCRGREIRRDSSSSNPQDHAGPAKILDERWRARRRRPLAQLGPSH